MDTKVEISKKLVLINSGSSVIARALNVSVLVWMHQYLLHRISPEEYSLLPVLLAVMAFTPLLTTILTSGLGRYIVEAYAKNDERRIVQIVSTMFPLLLAAGLGVFAGGCVFSWYIDHVFKIDPERIWEARIMMALLIFSLAVRLPLSPFGVGLYVRQKFVLRNLINVCAEVLRITILFVLLVAVSPRVLWVVVAMVSTELVRLLVRMIVSRRLVPSLRFRFREITWSCARQITSFGMWNFVGEIARIIHSAAAPIILNKLATPLDVTCFHIGSIASRQFGSWHSFVYTPLLPALTAMHATQSRKKLRRAYLRGGRYALWAAVLFGLPFIIFRQEIITLYIGPKFLPAATVMGLLLVMLPIVMGQEMIFSIAHACAQLGTTTKRAIAIQFMSLGLMLYLVGVMKTGAIGAALAVMISGIVGTALLIYPMAFRMVEVRFSRWRRETLVPGILPGIPATAAWLAMRTIIHPETWMQLALCAVVGGIVFVAVLVIFCLQDYEKTELKSVMVTIKQYFAKPTPRMEDSSDS